MKYVGTYRDQSSQWFIRFRNDSNEIVEHGPYASAAQAIKENMGVERHKPSDVNSTKSRQSRQDKTRRSE